MGRPRVDERQRARAQSLGRLLADSRQQRSLSQEQLARSAEVSVDTLRSIEQHRTVAPSFFLVAALAGTLDLSLDELAKDTEVN
ncbi:MAG TPA: helix-turn-helix transcriptional regulator [Solirubrobacterales bacterium]